MTEIARSLDTGEIVEAKDVWESSITDNSDCPFTGNKQFTCLDEENCNVRLTLVNFGNSGANRVYFKQSSNLNGHTPNCTMEFGTPEDISKLLRNLDNKLNSKERLRISKNQGRDIEISERAHTNIEKTKNIDINSESTNRYLMPNIQPMNGSSKPINHGLRSQRVTSLGAIYLRYIENPHQHVSKINWPSYDHNSNRLSFITNLINKKQFELQEIFQPVNSKTIFQTNKCLIYVGKAFISTTPRNADAISNATKIRFVFLHNTAIRTPFIDLKKLNGFPNKDIILNVINSHDNSPLKIVIVGHVYPKDGNTFFLPRTNNMCDWLFIPDPEA